MQKIEASFDVRKITFKDQNQSSPKPQGQS